MNYKETLEYLYTKLPMFQRVGSAAYKANLDNTIAICKLLDNPERKFKTIHVGGTNGKGSTSHLLASILQCAGYKVGLYTSPHLTDFRERIKINGTKISEQAVVTFVEQYIPLAEENNLELSFFEMTVGMAFDFFANEEVDIAVIEVGLGGRLDSTNVISPELSIITNISFDHKALLGDTLVAIAKEKAGIIKYETPVIISEKQADTKDVFIDKSIERSAPIYFASDIYKVKNVQHKNIERPLLSMDITWKGNMMYRDLECELLGLYQQKNIPAVLLAVNELKKKDYHITEANVRNGIRNVISKTGLLGRWQILNQQPMTIADTGHNEAGIQEVLSQISTIPHKTLHFVLAMVNDKDISAVLSLLPVQAVYYFSNANIPRALPAEELALQASTHHLQGKVYPSIKEAYQSAKQNAGKDDLILIAGSTFTVAEVLESENL